MTGRARSGRSRVPTLTHQLADRRGQRVVLVSHCLLNQNTRYLGGAGHTGCVPQIVTACVETGLGMVQLACPEEQAWGGVLKRRLLLVYGSNTWLPGPLRRLLLPVAVAYTKVRYRRQARRVTRQIADYQRGGIAVVGVIGVDGSPSCGLNRTLDIPRVVERLATIDPDSLTTSQMNSIVTDSLRPGPGLFTGALQRRLARTGHPVTYLAHDLPAELRGEPPTVAAALRTLSTGLSALPVGCRRRDGT